MKLNYQTLHAHTTNSDGRLSHEELLLECEKYGFNTLAFTDHDALLSLKKVEKLKKTTGNVSWISGIEISSGWPLELGGGATSGLHVVGLFVDPTSKFLIDHCKKAKEARLSRMETMVSNLSSLGFSISKDDCLKASNGESVGRPHIVAALGYHKENDLIIKQLVKKMHNDSKTDKDLKEKYNYMIERGEKQFPYILFLSDDSYIKGIYVDYQYFVDLDRTVKLIRDAGGVSILAHWGTCRSKLDDIFLDKLFREDRLDGAEVVYGLWNYNTEKWKKQKDELEIITTILQKNKKLVSGGADAHTIEDLQEFSETKWFSEKTKGLVEEIIKQSKIDTNWSSIR